MATEQNMSDPIAIIGIGCRFPGGVIDPDTFWELLVNGAIGTDVVPADRWNVDAFYDVAMNRFNRINNRHGGFLAGIDLFDAAFFGISDREAHWMDPQQRMLLEVSWEAMEDGGLLPAQLSGSPVGVFVGIAGHDYSDLQQKSRVADVYTNTGNANSIASNRISYTFNLKGPCFSVDTACSSSLVALHLACQSIRSGESSLALVGGVNVVLNPNISVGFSRAGMLSPDGCCQVFDERANGYVRGEGVGVVILQPLSQAVQEGRNIYAVIRASGTNQDGKTTGLMFPSRESQAALLDSVYRSAGIGMNCVTYVEAHGTGTPVGDWVELNAISDVISRSNGRPPLVVGSVKGNIGHLEAASGIAGLIKLALCLKHRKIPPTVHFRRHHPQLDPGTLNLRVATELEDWGAHSDALIGGVNSFGFGGSNAHAVLESAPAQHTCPTPGCAPEEPPRLIPVSARSETALRAYAGRLKAFLEGRPGTAARSLHDLGFNLSTRREHHPVRLAVLAATPEGVTADLESFLNGQTPETICRPQPASGQARTRIFVFSGQGSQCWAMARELMEHEPLVRATIQQCDAILRKQVDWSLWEELHASEAQSRISQRTDIAQPAMFAVQIALAALWESFGIAADAVVGHSAGEIAAAHFAGVYSLEDSLAILAHRSRLQYRTLGQGKMMAVALPAEELAETIRAFGSVCIAGINAYDATVLSGDEGQLNRIAEMLQQREVFHKFLGLDHPFHSPYLEPIKDEFLDALRVFTPRPGRIPVYSTVTGRQEKGETLDALHWWRNVRQPVLFRDAICTILQEEGECIFVEISNHPALSGYISQCLVRNQKKGHVVCSLKRNQSDYRTMLTSLGQLYCLGETVRWGALYPEGTDCKLPTYAWDHKRFWCEPLESRKNRLVHRKHPYLDYDICATYPTWRMDFNKESFPYLKDHRVRGNLVFPGAGYVELALGAFAQNVDERPCDLENIRFRRVFLVPSSDVASFQIVHRVQSSEFQIFSCGKSLEDEPVLHCDGSISALRQESHSTNGELETLKSSFGPEAEYAQVYEDFADIGLDYGKCFRGIRSLRRREGEALAEICVGEIPAEQRARYRFHPCYLDSCFQVLFGAIPQGACQDARPTYLPVKIDRIRYFGPPDEVVWAHARVTKCTSQNIQGDIRIYDGSGTLLAEISGFCCEAVKDAGRAERQPCADWFYQFEWVEQPLQAGRTDTGNWLLLQDAGGVGDALAEKLACEGNRVFTVIGGEGFERRGEGSFAIDPSDLSHWESVIGALCPDGQAGIRHVAILWGLDGPPSDGTTAENLRGRQAMLTEACVHLVRVLSAQRPQDSPRIWIVTRATQVVRPTDRIDSIGSSCLWGLARVIANEMPAYRCTLIDLDSLHGPGGLSLLHEELVADQAETEVSFRGDTRFVHRFISVASDKVMPQAPRQEVPIESRRFALQKSSLGTLESLSLCETDEPSLGRDDVKIQVRAAGLNFRDTMKAMGIYPTEDEHDCLLGDECAGLVVATGENVKDLQVGDAVIAATQGCLASYVNAPSKFVLTKPENMTFGEAATVPVAFITAYYAMVQLARLRKGETILIHAASGGVGQAAIQVARLRGARILATAGTAEKRDFLKGQGIEHVMDSRSLDFADQTLKATDGQGVDVVLNSIPGHALRKSLEITRPYGRFLEIGKIDIYQGNKIGLWPFRKNIAFFAIDLADVCKHRQGLLRVLLKRIHGLFEQGKLHPLPCTTFPVAEYGSAFRHLAQAKHIGKIVLSFPPEEKVSIATLPKAPKVVESDATYLVTGGYSGFGFAVARWLAESGARHLVLLGRSGSVPAEVSPQIARLRESGVHIEIVAGDAAQPEAIRDVVGRIRTQMPPLRGIVHAAMVLDDDAAIRLTRDRFDRVMAPKVIGAWNLHTETLGDKLDFFILCSSAAGLLGNPGQANYAAANAFLDALAQYRASLGLPALAVDWGVFSGVGYVSRHEKTAQLLRKQGLKGIDPRQAMAVLGHLLAKNIPQMGVIRADWRSFAGLALPVVHSPVFAPVLEAAAGGARGGDEAFASVILSLKEGERLDAITQRLGREIAGILGMGETSLDYHKSLNSLGLDSLMALELRNRVNNDLGIELSMTDVARGPSIAELSKTILNRILSVHDAGAGGGDGPTETSRRPAAAPIGPGAAAQPTEPRAVTVLAAGPQAPDAHEPFPLTVLQKAYWTGRNSTFPLCNVACHAYMESDVVDLDLPRLESAANRMIARHEMLRAVVLPDGTQQVLKDVPQYHIDEQDVRGLTDSERQQRLQSIRDGWSHRKCDPQKWPICELSATRIDQKTTRVHFSFDLLVGDLTSLQIMIYELTVLYNGLDIVLPEIRMSFREYVLAQEQAKNLSLCTDSKAYWLGRVDTLPPGPELPLRCDPLTVGKPRFSRRSLTLNREQWRRLKARASSIGVIPSSLILAAYAEVLSFFSKSPHFCITTTLSNRMSLAGENVGHGNCLSTIGDFSSTLLVEIDNRHEESFEQRIKRHHNQLWSDFKYRHFSGVEVLRELARTRRQGVITTVPVVFTCHIGQARPLLDEQIKPLLKELTYSVSQTPQVWIDHQALAVEEELMCTWDVVDELFPPGLVDDMFNLYADLLTGLAETSSPQGIPAVAPAR